MKNALRPVLRFAGFTDDWVKKTFDTIYTFRSTNSLSREKLNYADGRVRNLHYGDIHTKFQATFNIKKEIVPYVNLDVDLSKTPDDNFCKRGDLVIADASEDYSDIGKSIELVEINNEKVVAGLHTFLARPDKAKIASGFGAFMMQSAYVRLQVKTIAQGTKVLGLSTTRLAKIILVTPSYEEQKQISNFLISIDSKIHLLEKKLELLAQYKKIVMQRLFNQQIRFKDSHGKNYPNWSIKKLNELLSESKHRNYDMKYDKGNVLSVSGEYGIVNQIEHMGRSYAGVSVANYHVVEKGDIVYTKSPLKSNPFGIIKVNQGEPGIVSTLYAVYKCKTNVDGKYLDYYFQIDDNTNKYLRPLVHKGAKNDMKINNEHVLTNTISIPEKEEQVNIVTFLVSIDEKINHLKYQLENARMFKKGLLQKMFV